MKAITLHQPWASLLACGAKKTETRSWPPLASIIGQRIAIHAGLKKVHKHDAQLLWGVVNRLPWYVPGKPVTLEIPGGSVIATAKLLTAFRVGQHSNPSPGAFASCDLTHQGLCPGALHTAEVDAYGDYSVGRWIWVLGQLEELPEQVPAKGHQGFWNWEEGNG